LQKCIRNNDATVRIDGYFRTNSNRGQSALAGDNQRVYLSPSCETILAHFAGEKINHRNYYPPAAESKVESIAGKKPAAMQVVAELAAKWRLVATWCIILVNDHAATTLTINNAIQREHSVVAGRTLREQPIN
jgi:hypothetical protein